jgi:hypothetical protein
MGRNRINGTPTGALVESYRTEGGLGKGWWPTLRCPNKNVAGTGKGSAEQFLTESVQTNVDIRVNG